MKKIILVVWLGLSSFMKASEPDLISIATQLYESFKSFKSGKSEVILTYEMLTGDLGPPTLLRERGGLYSDYYWYFNNSIGGFCAIFVGTEVISVSFDGQGKKCEFESSGYNMLLDEELSRMLRSDQKIVPIDPLVRKTWANFK